MDYFLCSTSLCKFTRRYNVSNYFCAECMDAFITVGAPWDIADTIDLLMTMHPVGKDLRFRGFVQSYEDTPLSMLIVSYVFRIGFENMMLVTRFR